MTYPALVQVVFSLNILQIQDYHWRFGIDSEKTGPQIVNEQFGIEVEIIKRKKETISLAKKDTLTHTIIIIIIYSEDI